MNGYGSHTYLWVNAAGEKFWVKYHFHTRQGMAFFSNAEAAAMAGADSDHHQGDLFKAIARGEHPSWQLPVQVMPYAEAKSYRFNPFDLTKTWSHKDYPLIPVGTMTLNRNPENFFAQIEQAAFSPGYTVPGIGLSPDKMLLGRAFAYAEAQRNRIGANFHQLPVNQPKVPVNTLHVRRPDGLAAPRRCTRPTAPASLVGCHRCRGRRLGGRRRDGAQRLHAARGGRRLRPGLHALHEVFNDAQRAALVDQVAASVAKPRFVALDRFRAGRRARPFYHRKSALRAEARGRRLSRRKRSIT